MKGSKLLTCVAALGMVLTVGACDGGQSANDIIASSENPVEAIFDSIEENVNYHATVNMTQLKSASYTDTDELFESGYESALANEGNGWTYGVDIYYTEDVAAFVYHYPYNNEEIDDIEIYVYDEETDTSTYYAFLYAVNEDGTDYLYDEDGNRLVYFGPAYSWEGGLYDGLGTLLLLDDVRDDFTEIALEGTSEASGDYVRYAMSDAVAEGLFYGLLWDNYLGAYSGFPEVWIGWMESCLGTLQSGYPEMGWGIDDVVSSIYWREAKTWQVMFEDLGEYFYYTGTEGIGKQAYTIYFIYLNRMWANVTDVGDTVIPNELGEIVAPYTWDEVVQAGE